MIKSFLSILLFLFISTSLQAQKPVTDFVNPFLGTATLWDSIDIGYKPTHRTWGAEVFPGSALPNAMVQLSPVTSIKVVLVINMKILSYMLLSIPAKDIGIYAIFHYCP